MLDPLLNFDFKRQQKETEKALVKIFSNRIKESFLREMKYKVIQEHPDFLQFFDLRFDNLKSATGTEDWQWDYEIYRNIVGIHRSNSLLLTKQELKDLEKKDAYKKQLADEVYEHLKLRNYTSAYFRRRQIIQGDEFIYFPMPYKLFALCIKGLQILQDFKDNKYRTFYVNIFNKALAALALMEDNLLDNAYPICRGILELYIKLLALIDFPDALDLHNKLIDQEAEVTANGGDFPEEFNNIFSKRKRKDQDNPIDYLHYGWVDEIKYYHQTVKRKPYSINGVISFLKGIVPDEKSTTMEVVPILYKRCHAFTHGSLGNEGVPLVHYFNITMILYITLLHSFRLLVDDAKADDLINGDSIDDLITSNAETFQKQFYNLDDEMIKNFYNPK